MMAPDKLIQTFDACVLGWAEGQFTRELQSGFARLRQFDGADCREILDILEQQPRKQLEELAKALPLGAFWEHPQDIEKRRHLPESQRQAVENLRTIYDQRYREHFSEHVERIRESRSASALKQFKHAAKKGTRLVNGIASQWGWNVATAAPGEWGLILNEPHFRTTVSLNLGRDLSLYYHVSLFDEIHSRSVRFRDDYLKVLGLGQGCWKIERIECLPEKLVHASEFAFWHVGEYQGILKSILSVEPDHPDRVLPSPAPKNRAVPNNLRKSANLRIQKTSLRLLLHRAWFRTKTRLPSRRAAGYQIADEGRTGSAV